MERIISDECLKSIMLACYAAGMHRRDLYTVRGPDGPEVVRCKDCKHSSEVYSVDLTEMEPCPDGKLDCGHFSVWDHYDDIPGYCFVDSDGFCAWGERA